MGSWSDFRAGAPEMAAAGEERLFRSGTGDGLLSTVAGNGLPRTHPVNVGIVDGRLLTFVQDASAKARDLASDGRRPGRVAAALHLVAPAPALTDG
jgi:hypothetical protein